MDDDEAVKFDIEEILDEKFELLESRQKDNLKFKQAIKDIMKECLDETKLVTEEYRQMELMTKKIKLLERASKLVYEIHNKRKKTNPTELSEIVSQMWDLEMIQFKSYAYLLSIHKDYEDWQAKLLANFSKVCDDQETI